MRKSRRGIRDEGAHDLELADVNEQELAKAVADGEPESVGEIDLYARQNEETQGGIAGTEPKGSADEMQFVIVGQSGGEIVARGEDSVEAVSAEEEASESQSEATGGENAPPEDISGGEDLQDNNRISRIYVAVIAVCMTLALLVLGLAAIYGTASRDVEVQTQPSGESESQTDRAELPNYGNDDEAGALDSLLQSAVSVVAEKDGAVLCATGTAVLEDGYVATVYSAVKGASSVKIVLEDGSAYPADVVAYNEAVGLALLSTDAKQLRAVRAGDADLSVGQTVYAIGNADDALASSFFVGRVSYTSRSYEFNVGGNVRIANTVQISGFDNESMQGCPVFNQNGEVIAIAFATLPGKNTCFALPIEGVLSVLDTMKDGREPSKEAIEMLAYSPATMSVWGKQSCIDGIWGVEIMDFEDREGDSAVKLRRGDLIYRINDTFVAGTDALAAELSELRAGDEAQIYVLRGGQRLSFDVILGENE